MTKLALAMLLALAPAAQAQPAAMAAEQSFARLKTLVGAWRGKWSDGRPVALTYRLSAGGTVLVETWALGRDRESLTLYHLDGTALLATHYCPQGNQPRLRLVRATANNMAFAFKDATNLKPGASHQHAFDLAFDGPDKIARRETYRTGKADELDSVVFERITTS